MGYFARICWNSKHWCEPSGPDGKSLNAGSYERTHGFGHEEWLLDTSKLLDGYHYAHLQAFRNKTNDWRIDKNNVNITLFSFERRNAGLDIWWKIGKIKISGITDAESAIIFQKYRGNGWVEEMDYQLDRVPRGTENAEEIGILAAEENHGMFFNIKFKPEDVVLSEEPEQVTSETTLNTLRNCHRYSNLYEIREGQEIQNNAEQQRNRIPFQGEPAPQEGGPQEGNPQEGGGGCLYRRKKNSKVHKKMQDGIWAQLGDECGVRRERLIETDCSVDIAVQLDGGCEIFYEIKTSNTVKECIREAFGQIMEYAYYPADNHEVYERATGLVIVSQNAINAGARSYIDKLREFGINIYYQQFNLETNTLVDAYPTNPLNIECN